MAQEAGLSVDMAGFQAAMEAAKELSRAGAKKGAGSELKFEAEATAYLQNRWAAGTRPAAATVWAAVGGRSACRWGASHRSWKGSRGGASGPRRGSSPGGAKSQWAQTGLASWTSACPAARQAAEGDRRPSLSVATCYGPI